METGTRCRNRVRVVFVEESAPTPRAFGVHEYYGDNGPEDLDRHPARNASRGVARRGSDVTVGFPVPGSG